MTDLAVKLAGLSLRNPTLLASGILDETGGSLLRVFKSGAGAVVSKSICLHPRAGYKNPTIVELENGMINAMGLPNPGVEDYGAEITKAVKSGVILVGSAFGKDEHEYASVAKEFEKHGAAAVELNLSCPHAKGLGLEIAQSAEAVEGFTRTVKNAVRIPVMPKLSPNVTNVANLGLAAERGGADAVVAINTVKAIAISAELRTPVLSNKHGGLSGPAIKPIGLRCVYDLYEAVDIPIIGVGGVTTGLDAVEYFMAGASAVQIGTALRTRGYSAFRLICKEIQQFMEKEGFKTVGEMVGLAHE
jgi:dihydroorotate dehydrogenase (NAD+) catalytic subunit